MKLKEALERLENERFSIDYKVNGYHWELTLFKDDNEILEEYSSTRLSFLLEKFLNIKVENKEANELIFIENNYQTKDDDGLNVYLEFDNEDKKGFIHLETGYSEQEIELKNFDSFVTKIVDMEIIIENFINEDIDNRKEYKKVI